MILMQCKKFILGGVKMSEQKTLWEIQKELKPKVEDFAMELKNKEDYYNLINSNFAQQKQANALK